MMERRSIITDLAIEAHELVKEQTVRGAQQKEDNIPGVEVTNAGNDDIKISRVKINSLAGQNALGKPMGNYITLEVQGIKYNDTELCDIGKPPFKRERSGTCRRSQQEPSRRIATCF